MSKIIIHNETNFGDDEVLGLISEIIADGRVSGGGKCYCYATVSQVLGVVVTAKKNKNSDTFYVRDIQ